MKGLKEQDWDLFQAYAIRDAEICADNALRMIRLSLRTHCHPTDLDSFDSYPRGPHNDS